MPHIDVVIAGGGPVGSALAVALADAGLVVRLFEPRAEPDTKFRPIALSHGSRLILEGLALFDRFSATPIETIHVSHAGGFGRAVLRHEEHGIAALGYVCDMGDFALALAGASASQRSPGRVSSWQPRDDDVAVSVEHAGKTQQITARLLVLADGGPAALQAAGEVEGRDYHQAAIVALVRAEHMPVGTAWERFTDEGPLALLPFAPPAREMQYGLVWTVHEQRAHTLAAAADDAFLAALGARFGMRLGRFIASGPRLVYPLALRYRRASVTAPRVTAIGNAAQTLHPVAGQGLNLALRDVFELARLIVESPRADLGGRRFLERFASLRRADRTAAIGVTDALVRIFASRLPGAGLARGIGLATLDITPPARRFLARRMMLGLRGLP
jgi:2-octaprenyl-6-methoxyphenol hydroxylase